MTQDFDAIIIGGGATGAGTALDMALRGLRVAMVERVDLCEGTSGVTTAFCTRAGVML